MLTDSLKTQMSNTKDHKIKKRHCSSISEYLGDIVLNVN